MPAPLPTRLLGKTGHRVTLFALGGEGVLRTTGREQEAVAVIHRALDEGVNYCDTAPAYADSLRYYGAALADRRSQVFLASKTHDRTRDGSLRLLDESLKRLRTDHLDLWQLHDLRTMDDLNRIFSPTGAIEALKEAQAAGRVRFLGLTGHHDPAILLEAMRRFSFDNLLVALNAADVHRLSFIQTVLPEAVRQGLGVVAMKIFSQGILLRPGGLTADVAYQYALSLPGVCTSVIGCHTPEQVSYNAELARNWALLNQEEMQQIETHTRPMHAAYCYYKKT